MLLRRAWILPLMLSCALPARAQESVYTTHDEGSADGAGLPWLRQQQQQMPSGYRPSVPGPGDLPFRKATPYGAQNVPAAGLPMNRAVPVENIDGVEVSEPAAPAPMVDVANPAEEDPAAPTEMNAPLFDASADSKTPRSIVLRVLNKVTARAETITARRGEIIEFGKLRIEAENCYNSAPSSQPDAVALLTLREHVPEKKEPKLLFHGWMYASSPSITALEHPIYDVTMVECKMAGAAKEEAKDAVDDKKVPAKKQ